MRVAAALALMILAMLAASSSHPDAADLQPATVLALRQKP